MPLLLEIVTPEKLVFSEDVDHVAVTTAAGEVDLMPGHVPLLSILEPGELKFGQGQNSSSMAVDRGFVQIQGDKVSILTEAAVNVEKIDMSAVDDARKAAEEAIAKAKEQGEDPAVIEELETKARFAVVQGLIKGRKG